MLTYNECLEAIQKEINQLSHFAKEPKELYDPIQYIMQIGGKRLRPAMVLMAANVFSDATNDAIPVSLAIEIFHNFTLVHDDIMDNAPLRRNQLTVHEKWDNNIAILSGDAMQIMAYQLLCKSKPALLPILIETFNNTALEVCEGQQYDMNFINRDDVSLPEYLRMIELKTSVLLAASLKMGALCGGATLEEAQKLYEFGKNLGIAFQIKDDYLDVYADQEVFGKTIGGDIVENKKTFLLIKALELAKNEDAEILRKAVNGQIADTDIKIEMVQMVYEDLNIQEITKDAISEYSTKAFEWLESVSISSERKKPLHQLALDLMNRIK
jgi:geranylgeranyl diphosphate synthase, type II